MRYESSFEIDLQLLSRNVEAIKKIAPKNKVIFMAKANAYGHGDIEVVDFISRQNNIKEFGLATLGEAMRLRQSLPDKKIELYVFSDLSFSQPSLREHYLDYRIIPIISSLEDLQIFLEDKRFNKFPLFLKFDTGMNRLGITWNKTAQAIQLLKNYGRMSVQHLMSHFSSSYLQKSKKTTEQYDLFYKIKKEFHANGVSIEATSMSNSGALEKGLALEETHIRPGLILYGPSGLMPAGREASFFEGKNISSLKAKILKVAKIKKGTPIGYGDFICPKDGLVATLAMGYADGILNYYSGAIISDRGLEGQFIGRISMDLSFILFDHKAALELSKRKEIFIWNKDDDSILNLSDQVKVIPYQLFTTISPRIRRIYQFDERR